MRTYCIAPNIALCGDLDGKEIQGRGGIYRYIYIYIHTHGADSSSSAAETNASCEATVQQKLTEKREHCSDSLLGDPCLGPWGCCREALEGSGLNSKQGFLTALEAGRAALGSQRGGFW